MKKFWSAKQVDVLARSVISSLDKFVVVDVVDSSCEEREEYEISILQCVRDGYRKSLTFAVDGCFEVEGMRAAIIAELPISRNAKYELKQKLSGLKKVTFWIPEEQEPELQLLCKKLCENRDLFFTSARMRSRETGRFIPKGDL